MATEWNINTDIYDIMDNLKNLQKRYIEDEDETTLSLGVFGFIADTEAKKIQTATIMAGQLGNEMFPTRARLTKNVLAHAIYNGITNINAVPAKMTITLCIKISDIEKYINADDEFFIDSLCPIFIEDYEFHFDFDIRIKRKKISESGYAYSAQYVIYDENDEKITNPLSDITNPYIKQPFIINIESEEYIGIQCIVRQCSIEEITDIIVSDSVIENKSYTFEFNNQLAGFKIICTDNKEEIELTPYMYGSIITSDKPYCWYLFTSDNTVRITFDAKSYMPGLNTNVYIKIFNTIGAKGNFEYLNIDQTSEGLYVDIDSVLYNYKPITCYLVAVTDSTDGTDKKSKEDLQKLIPKAAMSRGNITTETDLNNYFNLINTDDKRLVMKKKIDNQLNRIWYGYFLLKDDNGNIIPTNTINLKLSINDVKVLLCDDGRYILPSGSSIKLDPSNRIATVIDDSEVPELYSDKYFNNGYYYYTTLYNTVLCTDPIYAAYYYTSFNYQSYFLYDYVNEDCDTQFIANRFHFQRKLITEQSDYKLNFGIAQSILSSEFGLNYITERVIVKPDGSKEIEEIKTQNLRVILVLYRDNLPYRWIECDYNWDTSNSNNGIYNFEVIMSSDNMMDDNNRIKILGLNEAGSNKTVYGYFDSDIEASIYILSKVPTTTNFKYQRRDIDNIAPGYEEYTVSNIYKCIDGLKFFENYTGITDTRVEQSGDDNDTYFIYGIPCVGKHYLDTDEECSYLLEAVEEQKAYIDYCLNLLENSMNVDFKLFNTYGPTTTFTLEDKTTSIGNVDISLRFKLSLKDSSDITTKDDIINSIKKYIENLNNIEDFHAPNLITDIINEYNDRIYFIEFVGFNKFGADDQHIINISEDSPSIVPEFINVRNYKDKETNQLVPNITIDLVK